VGVGQPRALGPPLPRTWPSSASAASPRLTGAAHARPPGSGIPSASSLTDSSASDFTSDSSPAPGAPVRPGKHLVSGASLLPALTQGGAPRVGGEGGGVGDGRWARPGSAGPLLEGLEACDELVTSWQQPVRKQDSWPPEDPWCPAPLLRVPFPFPTHPPAHAFPGPPLRAAWAPPSVSPRGQRGARSRRPPAGTRAQAFGRGGTREGAGSDTSDSSAQLPWQRTRGLVPPSPLGSHGYTGGVPHSGPLLWGYTGVCLGYSWAGHRG